MTNATTFTQTFPDGFTVQITGNRVGTNDARQNEWLDVGAVASSAATLARFAPAGQTANSLVALAAHQQRAAWIGSQQLLNMGAAQ
jgi:hypothetical protein